MRVSFTICSVIGHCKQIWPSCYDDKLSECDLISLAAATGHSYRSPPLVSAPKRYRPPRLADDSKWSDCFFFDQGHRSKQNTDYSGPDSLEQFDRMLARSSPERTSRVSEIKQIIHCLVSNPRQKNKTLQRVNA